MYSIDMTAEFSSRIEDALAVYSEVGNRYACHFCWDRIRCVFSLLLDGWVAGLSGTLILTPRRFPYSEALSRGAISMVRSSGFMVKGPASKRWSQVAA
jgi:hypothetical protein